MNKKLKIEATGITLIALIITVIILLILAAITINGLVGENGIITRAKEAKISTELANYKEEVQLYKLTKTSENSRFVGETLTAGKTDLNYNTKSDAETGNIKTVIPDISDTYFEKLEVIKGELLINTQDKNEIRVAQRLGIEVNPYDIRDGVLWSSNGNLLLMDENTGSLTIPDSVTAIGEGAFRGLDGLRTIIIPGTVKKIGDYAFSGNSTLENVIMEDGVETIGNYAFQDCISLKNIEIPNTVTSIGSTCFGDCTALESITIPGSIKDIPYRFVSNCINLTEIVISEGVETIGGSSFEGCKKIKQINIPSTVKSIFGSCFTGCSELTNINIDENNKNYSFKNGLLLSADGTTLYYALESLTELNIPDTVTTLAGGSLQRTPNLTVINIPATITEIDTVFFSSTIKAINVDSGNQNYVSINGNLYDKKIETLIRYCSNENTVTLPSTVQRIKLYAFYGKSNIKNINLPDSLLTLDSFAFQGSGISEIFIPKSVKSMTTNTFTGINIDISISDENETYKSEHGTYILSKDGETLIGVTKDMENYTIPSTVKNIGDNAFYSRNNLKEISLPSGITNIGSTAFDACLNLQKINIPSTITSIASNAFVRCNSLQEINIDKAEEEIKGSPWGCPYGDRAVKWNG